MTESKEVEVPKVPIPISHIVVLIILTLLIFCWGYITRTMAGPKYWTVTGAWLPWIYIMMLIAFLGRKGINIDRTFLIAVFYALLLVTAKWYYFSGTSEVDFINNISGTFSSALALGAWPSDAQRYLGKLLPNWLVVSDSAAANRYYLGGGEPMWGAFIGPIVTWTLIFLALSFMGLSLSFFLLGPEFYETEHLPFPITVPMVHVINNTYAEEKAKFGDIFFNVKAHKVFWAGVLIGIIVNIPYIISQVLPAIPVGAYIGGGYGVYPMEAIMPGIVDAVHSVFPNAVWITGSITLVCILIFMLVPIEVGTSALFWTFLLGWIYPGVATRLGILAPGADVYSSYPIPLGYLWDTGSEVAGSLGLGIIAIWLMRDRIKKAVSAFSKDKDFQVGGLSMRIGMIIFGISVLLFLAIWMAAGLDPLTTVLMFLYFLITTIGGTYHYAQLYWYLGACTAYSGWKLIQPVSAGLGLLPAVPTETSANAAVFGYSVATMGSCVGAFNTNCMINPSVLVLTYQAGASTRADLRRLFIYLATILVVLVPFSLAFDAWFNSHVGISNTSQFSMDLGWWNPASASMDLGVRTITWAAGTLPVVEQAAVMLASTVFLVFAYFISAKIPVLGYIFNPIGMVCMGYGWSPWLTVLLGVIFKYILNRIAGPRRAYEITIALISGIAVGFGILFPILGAYVWITTSAPNLAALWK
jgi:hypothetical protein